MRDGETRRLFEESIEPILDAMDAWLRESREVRGSDAAFCCDDPSVNDSRMRSNFLFLVSRAYDIVICEENVKKTSSEADH